MPRLAYLEAMCIALIRMTEKDIQVDGLTVLYLRFRVVF
jgi:hypothetical protein